MVLRLRAGIFLLSATALLFQFAQSRLFSATLGYHLSFLVVSGALLGVAIAGTAAAVIDARATRPSSSALALASAVATIIALLIETHIDPLTDGTLLATAAGYALGIAPVMFASWVIVRALRESPQSSGTLYAVDLIGAAVGGAIGFVGLGLLGAQGLYGLTAGLSLVAAAVLQERHGVDRARTGVVAIAAVATVLTLSIWGEQLAPPRPGPLKNIPSDLANGMVRDAVRWDPVARIDVLRSGDQGTPEQYGMLIDPRYTGPRARAMVIELDMGAVTVIVDGTRPADLSVFDASILSAAYTIAPRNKVLVIGPGGGADVVTALHEGARSVTAVEVNRAVISLMRGRYAAYSGGLYSDPRVNLVEDEARSFVRRATDRYDLLVMTLVDNQASLEVGAYALTESYLYTEEAMADYLGHLTPGGAVAVSRWYRQPPTEIVRTFRIAVAGFERLGRPDAARHIAVLKNGNFGLLIAAEGAMAASDVGRLADFASAHGFELAYDPLHPGPPFTLRPDEAPATDDRPFFFDPVPLSDILAGRAPLSYGYAILVVSLVLSGALALALALVPIHRRARGATSRALPSGTGTSLALGLGFIGAELILLQRLTLYLGQPSLALAIGIAALLGGAAAGSAWSMRAPFGVRRAAGTSAIVLLVILLVLPAVTSATLALPLPLRIAVALIAAGGIGVPLGTVFPKLLVGLGRIDPVLVSWAWAVNGSASVVGAIIGTGIALAVSFTALGIASVACYGLAALLAPADRT
ncbi:MAG: hypothetical protein M3O64_04025 [Chloroflexota bacterium]|nr:hypothetical protein [Chloroflexota bacterium]